MPGDSTKGDSHQTPFLLGLEFCAVSLRATVENLFQDISDKDNHVLKSLNIYSPGILCIAQLQFFISF